MSNIGNKETFAKNLVYYLNISGREQKEVANEIGVATSTFNDWATGKNYPRIDKIEKLANYFGIKKSDLIEDKKSTPEKMNLSEGEKMWMELYHRLSKETREMLITSLDSFDSLTPDQQQLALDLIRVALRQKK